MPHNEKMDTSSKKPKFSNIMHEEGEETKHDISKLRDQVQQILLSQIVTKNNWNLWWMLTWMV